MKCLDEYFVSQTVLEEVLLNIAPNVHSHIVRGVDDCGLKDWKIPAVSGTRRRAHFTTLLEPEYTSICPA